MICSVRLKHGGKFHITALHESDPQVEIIGGVSSAKETKLHQNSTMQLRLFLLKGAYKLEL
jgi:hypothetical protein